ncbi:MAG TPA: large conductance mechanosensitive channel protein MscL [Actinomycetota bacterium]|jgi:large conductance mechanosensitive channel|nr:large conductance mechanosensitive channel protein MscL [Actinomycetota bacterium]
MIQEFKAFLLRGNVVDLAVAVVVGAAFGAVVTSLVTDVLTPIIGMVAGDTDFSRLRAGPVRYGNFLNALFAFVTIAAAIFFFVVKPVNVLMANRKTQPDVEAPTVRCRHCLSNVPAEASVCAFCTRDL